MNLPIDFARTEPPWASRLLDPHPQAESLRDAARTVIQRARRAPRRSEIETTLQDSGPPALWAFVAEGIAAMEDPSRHGPLYRGSEIVEPLREAVAWVETRRTDPWPEVCWLMLEVAASVPPDQGPMRNQLEWVIEHIDDPQILRAGLAHWKMSLRSSVVKRLIALHSWTPEDAAAALEDPPLRKMCAAFLKDHPEGSDAVAPLRDHRLKSVRRLALEIQRADDPTAGLGRGTLADAEARLRIDPTDSEASLVWADLQQEHGDPRGQVVALEHAIHAALASGSHAEAATHSAELGVFVAENWNALWDRPGGVPFRDRWRGRTTVGFTSDWNHRMRGKGGQPLFDKIARFIGHLTDAAAPVARDAQSALWAFRWTHPGSDILLPFQDPGHHAGGATLGSELYVSLEDRQVRMQLHWPFETFEDPAFAAYFAECEKLLGKAFTKNRFRVYAANAAGDQLKGRLVAYSSKGRR